VAGLENFKNKQKHFKNYKFKNMNPFVFPFLLLFGIVVFVWLGFLVVVVCILFLFFPVFAGV